MRNALAWACSGLTAYLSAGIGGLIWTTAVAVLAPTPFETLWAHALLMLACLVLLPLGLGILIRLPSGEWKHLGIAVPFQLPAALLLGWSLRLPQGTTAAVLAIPWVLLTWLLLARTTAGLWQRGRSYDALTIDAAFLYLFVGSGWALLDRFGAQPLGFDPAVVLLTAIHFHHAGFVLSLVAGLILREARNRWSRGTALAVLAGTPHVAIGITATQLGFGPLLETVAACLLAASGVLLGGLQLRIAWSGARLAIARLLLGLAAVALIGGMILAALYGARFYLPVAWLDIPWMRAIHGTSNALGFGLLGLIGWGLVGRTK